MKYGTPNMTFYMSENSAWVVEKYQKIAKHLKAMRKAGIKIDGMFMQGHIYENSGTNEGMISYVAALVCIVACISVHTQQLLCMYHV